MDIIELGELRTDGKAVIGAEVVKFVNLQSQSQAVHSIPLM